MKVVVIITAIAAARGSAVPDRRVNVFTRIAGMFSVRTYAVIIVKKNRLTAF